MNPLEQSLIFGLATLLSVLSIGSFIVWVIEKYIASVNSKGNGLIIIISIAATFAIFLYSMLYYYNI